MMKTKNDIKHHLSLKVEKDIILFFDLDGTLVNTDFANFLSYKSAIQTVMKIDKKIPYNPNERFTRSALKNLFLDLTENNYETIIKEKEKNYEKYLYKTKLNKLIAEILVQYSKTNKTILVTNCREDRALMTLNYHRLTDKFSNLFFRRISVSDTTINKYKDAIINLNILAENVIVFENDKKEIEDAILAGILKNNVLIV